MPQVPAHLQGAHRHCESARQAAGESRLSLTISALRITSTHLSSAQLGITLTTLLTGYTMEPAISNLLAPVFDAWGIPEGVSRPLAAVIGDDIERPRFSGSSTGQATQIFDMAGCDRRHRPPERRDVDLFSRHPVTLTRHG